MAGLESFWPSSSLLLYLLSLLVLTNTVRRVRQWYRLRHIPGPPLAGWTSLWLTKGYFKATFTQDVPALVKKYGPVVRIGPDKVVCTDIATMYRISGVRSEYRKSDWYTISRVSRDHDHLLSMLDPVQRRERKKYVMPAYNGRGVDFEEGIDRALTAWTDLIDRKYLSTPGRVVPMDFEQKAHYFTLDALGEMAYSESFECLKQDRDTKGVVAVNDAAVPTLMAVGNYPGLWRLLRMWPFYLMFPHDGQETGFGGIVSHANSFIRQRLKLGATPRRDMLQSFIDNDLSGEALKQEVGILFFAGSDSTSSFLYTTLYLLLTHPAAYARLQAELDAEYAATHPQKHTTATTMKASHDPDKSITTIHPLPTPDPDSDPDLPNPYSNLPPSQTHPSTPPSTPPRHTTTKPSPSHNPSHTPQPAHTSHPSQPSRADHPSTARMTYLQATLREGLRLFPALTAPPLYKEVPPQGDTVCGYHLPGGTQIATGNAMWAGCREEGFWGGDAGCFRPERWVWEEEDDESTVGGGGGEGNGGGGGEKGDGGFGEGGERKRKRRPVGQARLADMVRRVELVFGSGQFVCVGRAIAMAEMARVMGELIRRYNWSLVDPLNPPRVDNNGVWTVRNFWVRVEKR